MIWLVYFQIGRAFAPISLLNDDLPSIANPTLRIAWERYRDGHMKQRPKRWDDQ